MRHPVRSVIGATATAALLLGPCTGSAQAAPGPDDTAVLQKALTSEQRKSLSPGAGFTYRLADGTTRHLSSGTTRNLTRTPFTDRTRVRAASNTKMFVATVVLQLVEEGKVDLDAPISRYLPGVITGKGLDENAITVRMLLSHRSGIKDNLGFAGGDYAQVMKVILNPLYQVRPPSLETMIKEGTKAGKQFEPGSKGAYSNTNYTALGLLIHKVTGSSPTRQIDERIVKPLGLTDTFLPESGDKHLPSPASHGYVGANLAALDVTGFEPGVWNTAGGVVSSGRDMNTFVRALVGGDLLEPASLAQMQKVQDVDAAGPYGLGLMRMDTDCGHAWGHTGQIAGYTTLTVTNPAGTRSAFLSENSTAFVKDNAARATLVNAALCH